ncbi:unnamed protein product [Nezara viridula]|uniref:GAF domain-containing protein n=1 Tax=Nezara viridula TaxID=85310 RepID=A0A9P0E767_NEZVI|nr:unnamed protein product [Nezara viridula]
MPGSRHFTVDAIRKDLPEKINEVELEKWQNISYLLQQGQSNTGKLIEKPSVRKIRLLKINGNRKEKTTFLKFLSEGALLIKEYIKAEIADVYIVEDEKICRLLYKHGYPSMGAAWPVGPGTVVSAYVAFCGETLILDEKSDYHKLYPLGTGRGGLKPIHLISIPMLTDDGNCKAVYEFGKISPDKKFNRAETSMCSCMVAWLGQSIITKPVQFGPSVETYQSLFSALERFQVSHADPEILISDILKVLLNTVPMEKVNYYEVIKGEEFRCRLRAQVGNDKWQCCPEYILKEGDFIKTIIDNHTSKSMSRDEIALLDEPLKYNFRGVVSYLCVPIGIKTKTRGVVELINKKDGDTFSDFDIDEATRCGIHCVAGLRFNRLYLKKQRTFAMCENQSRTLLRHMIPCSHDLELVKYKMANLNVPLIFSNLLTIHQKRNCRT